MTDMTDTTPTDTGNADPGTTSDILPPGTISDFNTAPNGRHLFTTTTLTPPQDLQAGGVVITERHGDIGWQMAIVNDQPRRIFQRSWQPKGDRWRSWKVFTDELLTTRRTDAAITAAVTNMRADIKADIKAGIGSDLNRRLTAEEQARADAIADAVNDAVNLLQQDLTDIESRQVDLGQVRSLVEAELADERQARDSAINAATTAIASTRQAGIDAAVSAAITTERAAADRRLDDRLAPVTTRLDDIADDVTAEAASRTAGIAAAKRELESAITAERTAWKQAILREGQARQSGDAAATTALEAETRARAQAITAGDNAVKAAVAADVTARLGQLESRLGARVAGAEFPRGTRMLFQQSSAPTGWTKDTSHHDKALRVVGGAVGGGGSKGFSATFGRGNIGVSSSISGRVGETSLSIPQLPAAIYIAPEYSPGHSTLVDNYAHFNYNPAVPDFRRFARRGGGRGHSHTAGSLRVTSGLTGGELDLRVRYLDVIVAVKD